MKNLKFFLIISLYILFSSCGTVKEAFTNKKKSSSDEFLVEKKSPLVMPPDYEILPEPSSNLMNNENDNLNIKTLISDNEGKKDDLQEQTSNKNHRSLIKFSNIIHIKTLFLDYKDLS